MSGPSPIFPPLAAEVYDGGAVSQAVLAPGFQGIGNTPAAMPNGLKSPWTRSVILDAGGKGDFSDPKVACDWAATQSPSLFSPIIIYVTAGSVWHYVLGNRPQSFRVPSFVGMISMGPPEGPDNAETIGIAPYMQMAPVDGHWSGDQIVVDDSAVIYGLTIEANSYFGGSQSDDMNLIHAYSFSKIINCRINTLLDAPGGKVQCGIKADSTGGGATAIVGCNFYSGNGGDKTKDYQVWSHGTGQVAVSGNSQFYNAGAEGGYGLYSDSALNSFIEYCLFDQEVSSSPGYTAEIYGAGAGKIVVQNVPYRHSPGNVDQRDRFFPSTAAVREAPAATDTPIISKGAAGQSANLSQEVDSADVVQHAIGPTGQIKTNQSAAATVAVGTLANKLPIYDAAGTLLGYIPIYTSIT